MIEREPLKVFYSYSHKDEQYKANLDNHLTNLMRRNLIEPWCDLKILPGDNWRSEIVSRIETSDVIILLVSADFLASDYCYSEEMRRALKMHSDGKAKVIPIYVRPVYIHELPFEHLQSLPKDAKPVESWASQDDAWVSVVEGIHKAIDDINGKRKLDFSLLQNNKTTSSQNFSNTLALGANFHQEPVGLENENGKIPHQSYSPDLTIDARAQRLKSIANRRDLSREDANAAIEETEGWLAEHGQDTNIRQIYLSLIEKRGTPEQVQRAIRNIEFWLDKRRSNTNVKTQYIILITERANIEKAKLVIKETEIWIERYKIKNESVLIAYLGLIEKWAGTIEQFQQGIKNVENWCPVSSQSSRLKDKLSKLRRRERKIESDERIQTSVKNPTGSLEMAQFNIDTFAQHLSYLAKEGSLEECTVAIEETRYWLNKYHEDTNIRQVYLKLIGREGIDNIQVQRALEETEAWLLKEEHRANTSVRQAYLRLVRNRGTLVQKKEALRNTKIWLERYDSAHIRDAYDKLIRAIEEY